MEYPLFNSKTLSQGSAYDLTNPVERLKYFHEKLGSRVEEVKAYLENNSFIGYMLAKKLAGKGTYAKMIEEILGSDRFAHISVGDVVRNYHSLLENPSTSQEIINYLHKNYRGVLSVDEAISALLNRTQDKVSVPTDFLLTLLKREIATVGRKALFIDGLPRNMDQISASLYFRDIINYREDQDFFIIIDAPLELLNTRLTHRRVCPLCGTSKNLLFNPSQYITYEPQANEYILLCDNKACTGYQKSACQAKAGDASGIKSIEQRLRDDEYLMQAAVNLQGIPKILVKNSVPVNQVATYYEDYEVQQAFNYSRDGDKVKIAKVNWVFKDDNGQDVVTSYAATFVVNIFVQLHKILVG